MEGQTGGVPGGADSVGPAQSGAVPVEAHGGAQGGIADGGGDASKKSQNQSKKVLLVFIFAAVSTRYPGPSSSLGALDLFVVLAP